MKTDEIKKALYNEKPIAYHNDTDENYVYYHAKLLNGFEVDFCISKKESEGFKDEMPAQLLIRWINY